MKPFEKLTKAKGLLAAWDVCTIKANVKSKNLKVVFMVKLIQINNSVLFVKVSTLTSEIFLTCDLNNRREVFP